ncbi:MAG: hypothetical protein JWQ98_15 [Chlorobi bacterium]|nr:hypothetical protein [Chlorobiota bacterium]
MHPRIDEQQYAPMELGIMENVALLQPVRPDGAESEIPNSWNLAFFEISCFLDGKADDRPMLIVRLLVQIKHMFHTPEEL